MIDGKFDVVFRGQVVRNMDESAVKANLVTLFKSSPEAVDKLFSGNEVVVRKDLDYSTAMKYQSALKKAGALALIKEIEQKNVAKPPSQGKATFGVAEQGEPTSSQQDTKTQNTAAELEASSQVAITTPVSSDSHSEASVTSTSAQESDQTSQGGMTIAEPGAQILPDKVYEKRDVDTSQLSLASTGERIMPEKPPEDYPQPSIEHLKLED